ncbi:MAG: hypothetical protein FVQ83_07960 [Chloroflexi bacterium]|nr:hypothetical protein [Chloroflexota bacterium]
MSTRRLVIGITFLAVFAMSARVAVDTDTWWHLRTGQLIVTERSIPGVDTFSHTRAGEAWQGPSVGWLMQVTLYLIFDTFGSGGLNLFQAIMVTLAFGFVYRSMSGDVFLRAFVIILAALASGVYWAARPYLMTFLLAALTLWIFEDYRWKRKDRLGWLPLVMVVWSNSHGGFAVGIMLWGIYALGEVVSWMGMARKEGKLLPTEFTRDWLDAGMRGRVGRMLLVGVLMLAGASFNFSGPSILLYPFQTVSIGALQEFIQEWQSPNFHDLQMQPFAWLLFLVLGALGISKKRLALTDFLLVAGFGYLGLLAGRNIALFALVAPAVLTRHAAPLANDLGCKVGLSNLSIDSPNVPRWQSVVNWGLLVILFLTVLIKVITVLPETVNRNAYADSVPVEAVEFLLAENPPGPILNSYNWGGYLIWAAPDYAVFLDGRTDLYGDKIISEWLQILRAEEGWQHLLNDWQIRLILVEPTWPLVDLLGGEGWENIYADDLAVIYAR